MIIPILQMRKQRLKRFSYPLWVVQWQGLQWNAGHLSPGPRCLTTAPQPQNPALIPIQIWFHLQTYSILCRSNCKWPPAFSTPSFPAPFLVTWLPCDPRASHISFSLSHQAHSFETTSLNYFWHSGIWQLSFGSAFHLIQLCATASELGNCLLCPCTLNFCFIKQGIRNLHCMACKYIRQLGNVFVLQLDIKIDFLQNLKILNCTNNTQECPLVQQWIAPEVTSLSSYLKSPYSLPNVCF